MLSPYTPVRLGRVAVAVWAMGGGGSLGSRVPCPLKKFSSAVICSRSDGTLGLSREKCVLSKTMLITCLTPLPSSQLDSAGLVDFAVGVTPLGCAAGTAANCQPIES